MADLGCRVHLFGCDVSVKEELAETLNSCKASLPPIRGVIHAGMVLQVCRVASIEQGLMPVIETYYLVYRTRFWNE